MKTLVWLLLLACILTVSCRTHGAPPSPEETPPSAILGSYPQASGSPPRPPSDPPDLADIASSPASGQVEGLPFPMKSALLWQDAVSTFISFAATVPETRGRFDPRARVNPDVRFLVYLTPRRIRTGQWEVTSETAARDATCPVSRVILQLPLPSPRSNQPLPHGRVRSIDSGWRLAFRIDRIVHRKAKDGGEFLNLKGGLALRFSAPVAWLAGSFVARDTLRDHEVEPDQPVVPAPTPRGGIPSPSP